ncbi:hypothetical protein HGRIS_005711 [Hohenbuehelia grisea]|uniref:DUF6534 domain-containing protein n=1 Tax=Hohenbuehelia grisea TaxID=104357 RepID=A0ABR3JZI3_9AGAR
MIGCGIDMTVQIASVPTFAHLAVPGVTAVVAVCQGLTFLGGLLTFGLLSFYLQPGRTPNVKPIHGWFDTLVAYTINRGSVATLVQLGFFITYLIAPGRLYWIPFHFVAAKLFVNSLLTMLNTREVIHGHGMNEEESVDRKRGQNSFLHSNVRSGNPVRFNVVDTKMSSHPGINIEVSRTVEQQEGIASKGPYDYNDQGSETIGESKATAL